MPSAPDVDRGFVTIGGREILVRRHGSGPPVLLLSDAPRSSRSLLDLIHRLAAGHTVLAPDLPGFGLSEPLAPGTAGIAAHADAVADTLAVLGVGPAPVYGVGTGAHVALALAQRHPDRVLRLVLEGVAKPTASEADLIRRHGAPEHPPVRSGAHLIELWSQVRDGHIFSPWFAADREHRRCADVPAAEVLHDAVMDVLLAQGSPADLLHARLDHDVAAARQAVLAAGIDIEEIDTDTDPALPARLLAGTLGSAAGAWPPPAGERDTGQLSRRYCPTSEGRLLVRASCGDGVPLVMLHGSPGSAISLLDLAQAIAAARPVLAFDTLGNGESDKPTWTDGSLARCAAVVGEALDGLGIGRCDVYGTHTGASIGLELAIARPGLVRGLVLDGVGLYEEAERRAHLRHYLTTDLIPRDDGTHLIAAWHMMSNATLFWPWYRADADHVRDVAPPTPERLHAIVLELLRSGPTYRLAYEAAFWHQTSDRLALVGLPLLLLTYRDDVLHDSTLSLATRLASARAHDLTAPEPAAVAEAIARFTAELD